MATRKAYIDAAKFIGILLVLMNHIELIFPFVNFYGGMFYVPVFFVAAGLTYYEKEEGLKAFVRKKAKRLLVPYFVSNGLLFLFFAGKDFILRKGFGKEQLIALLGIFYSRNSLYIPGTEPNLYFMTILNSPTWFLTAMFLTYLLVKFSFKITGGKEKELGLFGACMLFLGIIFHYFCPILLPWSLECIPLFYCYMIIGYFIREKGLLEKRKPLWLLLAGGTILFILSCSFNGSANISVGMFGKSIILGLFNGIFSSFLVLWLCKLGEACLPAGIVGFFSRLGTYTLTVLCYHMFLFALIKSGLQAVIPYIFNQAGISAAVVKLGMIVITIGLIVLAKKMFGNLLQRRRQ